MSLLSVPPECLESPCVGRPGVDGMLVLKFLVLMMLSGFAGYHLIVGILKFNDWRSQWRRR